MASPALTATNAGNVTHPTVVLNGPVFIALRIIGYAIPVAALAVVIDALRRPATHFGGSTARRWMWAGPQLALLALLAAGWAFVLLAPGFVPRLGALTAATALMLLVCVILQIAYLLIVVFPRHREPIPPEVEKELPRE